MTPPPISRWPRAPQAAQVAEGTWAVTTWDAPSYFEWTQKTGGATNVASHRVEALGDGRARLTLTLDMRGFLVPIIASNLVSVVDRSAAR